MASALLFSGALAFCLLACSKNAGKTSSNSTNSNTQVLTLSQSTVAKGQPLVASVPSGVSASSIRWTVSPSSAYTHLTTGNGQAMLLFAKAGSYRVTASYSAADSSGNDSCSAPVTVSDSVYCPGGPQNGYDTLSPCRRPGDARTSRRFRDIRGRTWCCWRSPTKHSPVSPVSFIRSRRQRTEFRLT